MLIRTAFVAALAAFPVSCIPAPSPAQQVADFTAVEQCVSSHWGEPVTQLAGDCLGGAVQATIDVIADIELLAEKSQDGGAPGGAVALPTIYAADSRVQDALAAKRLVRKPR